METCNGCIHLPVCETYNDYFGGNRCEYYKSTADVAPKSETAREILEEIEALATNHLALLEIINPQVSAVAAGGKHAFDLVLALTAELKKKYTEENDGN